MAGLAAGNANAQAVQNEAVQWQVRQAVQSRQTEAMHKLSDLMHNATAFLTTSQGYVEEVCLCCGAVNVQSHQSSANKHPRRLEWWRNAQSKGNFQENLEWALDLIKYEDGREDLRDVCNATAEAQDAFAKAFAKKTTQWNREKAPVANREAAGHARAAGAPAPPPPPPLGADQWSQQAAYAPPGLADVESLVERISQLERRVEELESQVQQQTTGWQTAQTW